MSLEDDRTIGCGEVPILRYNPFNISQDLLNRAGAGDQDAFSELDLIVRPRLLGYFYRRFPEEAEDLAQDSMIRIVSSINKFHGNLERPFSRQFTSWCFAIARNTLYSELGKRVKREKDFVPRVRDGDTRSFDEILSDLYYRSYPYNDTASTDLLSEDGDDKKLRPKNINQFLNDWFSKNLTEIQQKIIALRMTGKKNAEIKDELELGLRLIKKEIVEIRSRIENEILKPAHFCPLEEFQDESVVGLSRKNLDPAIYHGKLKVVRILGRVYTSFECLREYLAGRTDNFDETQLLNGLVRIGYYASPTEYNNFLKKSRLRNLLVFKNDRAYIHLDHLEDIKRERNQGTIKSDEKLSSDDGYIELKSIVETYNEYSRYRSAIAKGRLVAVKKGGIIWVKPDAITQYNKKYKP